MVYLQTLNYLPIILIISADKNEIMPICKEKEKYEHMQLIADYADKPSYLQICLFIGRYCRYTDKPIYGNAKSADTDIVSAAYLQIVSADNFIGCSLDGGDDEGGGPFRQRSFGNMQKWDRREKACRVWTGGKGLK